MQVTGLSMNKKNRKIIVLYTVLVVFIALDIWLLYGKVRMQQKVSSLQANLSQKGRLGSGSKDLVRYVPLESAADPPGNKPIRLIALFTDYGCIHCVQAEIGYLNKWDQNYPHTLTVYFKGASTKYLRQFGAKFNFRKVQSLQTLVNVSLPVGNPIVVAVDKNNNIQAIHTNDVSRPGSDLRRTNFYGRERSLFNSVYGDK